jgi:hypothetical protein
MVVKVRAPRHLTQCQRSPTTSTRTRRGDFRPDALDGPHVPLCACSKLDTVDEAGPGSYDNRVCLRQVMGVPGLRAPADLRMTFDTCQASDMEVGSDPWTLAAAETFLAARALIALGLAGMVGPCGCWSHAATPAASDLEAEATLVPRNRSWSEAAYSTHTP